MIIRDGTDRFSSSQIDALRRDFADGRARNQATRSDLQGILGNGGRPEGEGQQRALRDAERYYDNPRSGVSNRQLKDLIEMLEKLDQAVGEPGSGAYVAYGGAIPGPGLSPKVIASARIGQTGQLTVKVYDRYFEQERGGHPAMHELGHAVFGLTDNLPADRTTLGGGIVPSVRPGYNDGYLRDGVDAAIDVLDAVGENGLPLNDAFICTMGFRGC